MSTVQVQAQKIAITSAHMHDSQILPLLVTGKEDQIPLREISRISGISLSGYYYKPVKRHIQRLDPSIKERIRYIASERPTYGIEFGMTGLTFLLLSIFASLTVASIVLLKLQLIWQEYRSDTCAAREMGNFNDMKAVIVKASEFKKSQVSKKKYERVESILKKRLKYLERKYLLFAETNNLEKSL